MALALPIASQLHASAGITALGVMLTGQAASPMHVFIVLRPKCLGLYGSKEWMDE